MAQFFTVLTQTGQAKMANAIALGTMIEITQLAVGDGGGSLPQPDSSRETLINEVRRAPINRVEVDADNPNWLVVEQILPPDVGGWTIREVGIIDADGDLIGYGNYPETYKPTLDEGSGRTQTIRMVLEVSHTAAVTLRVDPSVVLATREHVDSEIDKHAQSRNHPAATETAQGMLEIANYEEALTGTDDVKAMTSKKVHAAFNQYGLGTDTLKVLSSDAELNAATKTGFYYVNGASSPGEPYGSLEVVSNIPNRTYQIFRPVSSATETSKEFFRFSLDGGSSWSAWTKKITEDDRASQGQAEDGTRSDLVMTPVRTRQAYEQYGLGAGKFKGTSDLGSLVEQGFYFVNSDTPGLPLASSGSLTVGGQNTKPSQTFIAAQENRTFVRTRYEEGGVYYWTPWVETSANYSGHVVFDSAGTYTWAVPDELKQGTKKAFVTVIGAGGGGRGMEVYWGGGGGGGIAKSLVDLTGVDSVTITVGAGGDGGAYDAVNGHGTHGGSSSFGEFFSATGGQRGGGFGVGGSGGTGVGGDFNGSLGSGDSVGVLPDDTQYYCGGTGGGPGGAGHRGRNDEPAEPGHWPGGGGGGGASPNSGPAGSGADGGVIIEW